MIEEAPPTPPAQSARERRFGAGVSLRSKTARGTIVNGLFIVFVNVVSMMRGFIVAAFLTTQEYGVWGVALVLVATLAVLKGVGVGDKFVQQDDVDQARAFKIALTLDLMLALTCTVLGTALVFAAAHFMDTREIIAPCLLLLLALPLGSFQLALFVFYRQMDFARQRLLQAVDPLVAFVVTIVLAASGAGYWSLVIGTLAGSLAAAIVAVIACPYPVGFAFAREDFRTYFSFSWPLLIAALSLGFTGQGLVAAGEASVGLAGVGVIALTAQISQLADRADRAITDTLYPAICAVKDRADLLYESFRTSNRLALMWALPFGLGVALFSEDLLVRMLGEHWRPGIDLMRATAIALGIHQIGFNWQAFYRARGDTKPIAVAGVVAIAVTGGLVIPMLLTWELKGLAFGILGAEVIYLCMRAYFLRRLFPTFNPLTYAARALGPLVIPTLAVLAMRAAESGDRTLVTAGTEAVVYLGLVIACTYTFERRLVREIVTYLRRRGLPVEPAAA